MGTCTTKISDKIEGVGYYVSQSHIFILCYKPFQNTLTLYPKWLKGIQVKQKYLDLFHWWQCSYKYRVPVYIGQLIYTYDFLN